VSQRGRREPEREGEELEREKRDRGGEES